MDKPTDDKLAIKQQSAIVSQTVENIKLATEIAEIIKASKAAKSFETVDNDNNVIPAKVEDIVATILFGAELGIAPMEAINLGTQLNRNTYYSIKRGSNMGLDVVTSMQNIYAFPANNRIVIYTGVHIISKVLNDARVKKEWVDDFKICYKYFLRKGGEELNASEVEGNSNYCIITPALTESDVVQAKNEGKVFVNRVPDRVTSCIFKREGFADVHIKYYLSDAIEAGLYRGVKSDGEKVDGKSNWNNYPRQQMRNRVLILGGREIVSDKLYDTYLEDEVSLINPKKSNIDTEDIEYQEV